LVRSERISTTAVPHWAEHIAADDCASAPEYV
jgi:hypothetical protein